MQKLKESDPWMKKKNEVAERLVKKGEQYFIDSVNKWEEKKLPKKNESFF